MAVGRSSRSVARHPRCPAIKNLLDEAVRFSQLCHLFGSRYSVRSIFQQWSAGTAGARLAAHNAGRCSHTAKHRPWAVDVFVTFADETRALKFEKYLQSGSGVESPELRGIRSQQVFKLAALQCKSQDRTRGVRVMHDSHKAGSTPVLLRTMSNLPRLIASASVRI